MFSDLIFREVCSQYGLFVDRQEVVGWDTWSGAPLNTFAWQIPMQVRQASTPLTHNPQIDVICYSR
jgi:hypothetical protein